MELNEIIKNLCDWCQKQEMIIREMSFYSRNGEVYVRISLGKNANGEQLAIDRIFHLGGALSSKSWEEYRNDLELECMIEELNKAN